MDPGDWRTPLELLPIEFRSFLHVEYIHVLYMDEWSLHGIYLINLIIWCPPSSLQPAPSMLRWVVATKPAHWLRYRLGCGAAAGCVFFFDFGIEEGCIEIQFVQFAS